MHHLSKLTEEEVIASIDKIVRLLAPSFKFGYYEVDDIKQEAFILAMKVLPKYDESRPLENFLYTHLKNRLINFRRDNYHRSDPPCKSCHNSVDGETSHDDRRYCKKYLAWYKRNANKKNIITPLDITNICDEKESNTRVNSDVEKDVEQQELLDLIDEHLPIELRSTYLQMRDGVQVPKSKRLEVEAAVLDILKDEIYE